MKPTSLLLAALLAAAINLPAYAVDALPKAPRTADGSRSSNPERPEKPAQKIKLKTVPTSELSERRHSQPNPKHQQSKPPALDIGCVTTE